MKRRLVAGYLIALHLLLGLALVQSDFRQRIAARLGFEVAGDAAFISTLRRIHAQMDASVPAGATLFLGDSITMALATAAVAPHAVNYGIGSQRSDHLLESMQAYRAIERAGAVVIAIGVNDLLQGRTAGIELRYQDILRAVPAAVRVVLSSPTPVAEIEPGRQVAVRDAARRACVARPGCTFVDGYALLSSSPGSLLPDGVHLSPAGYALWIPALRQALQ